MCGCIPTSDSRNETAAIKGAPEELLQSQVYSDNALCSTTEIHISCQNLADKDVFSKSDPFAILYSKSEQK